MKIGTTTRSLEEPNSGFTFRKEGFSIYAVYIPDDSITTVFVPDDIEPTGNELPGHMEYEYIEYSFYRAIDSYEDLVSKLIFLKYTLEDEMSLINKMISNKAIDEYEDYRSYVGLCRDAATQSYVNLGLQRKSN